MGIKSYENSHENLVNIVAKDMYQDYLIDNIKFDELNNGYEFLNANSNHIQRALRNLDDAIKGKEYARDAIFIALNYIQKNLKIHCSKIAEEEVADDEDRIER